MVIDEEIRLIGEQAEVSRQLFDTFQSNMVLIFFLGSWGFWFIEWGHHLIILFHLAPSRMLYGKKFLHYEFLKIYLRKIQIEFFSNFYDFVLGQ